MNGQTLTTFLKANNASYQIGKSMFAFDKSMADLGDEARKFTSLVECWK